MKRTAVYKGYHLLLRNVDTLPVAVFDPRFRYAPHVYAAQTLADAKKWIDAYRSGQIWAVDAARKSREVSPAASSQTA